MCLPHCSAPACPTLFPLLDSYQLHPPYQVWEEWDEEVQAAEALESEALAGHAQQDRDDEIKPFVHRSGLFGVDRATAQRALRSVHSRIGGRDQALCAQVGVWPRRPQRSVQSAAGTAGERWQGRPVAGRRYCSSRGSSYV